MKTTLTIILFLIALTASSQIISVGINYTSSGNPFAKLAFSSKTFGGYIKKKNDVSWIEGKTTDDSFQTENCLIAGVTYSFEKLTFNCGGGIYKTDFHILDMDWETEKQKAIEAGFSYKIINCRMFKMYLDGGLMYANEIQVYSGISLGLKIR